MENIKLGNLYLSKKESTNILEFLAKIRNKSQTIKSNQTVKANLVIDYMKYLKSNLKIKKE